MLRRWSFLTCAHHYVVLIYAPLEMLGGYYEKYLAALLLLKWENFTWWPANGIIKIPVYPNLFTSIFFRNPSMVKT